MTDCLTVMSWNLHGETTVSDSQRQNQLQFLDEHCTDVDVFLLQAVRNSESEGVRGDHLEAVLDYFEEHPREHFVAHTGDWSRELMESDVQPHADIIGSHNRCNVTVSRWPIERQSLDLRNIGHRKPRDLNYYYSHFPEKMLVTNLNTSADDSVGADMVEVRNVGIINGANWGEEKVNMLETVCSRIYLQTTKLDHPVILGGDFNAPKVETSDKKIIPHGGAKYIHYPFYGDPYYFNETGDAVEQTFGQRWRTAEQQLFNQELGEWGMQDAYLSSPGEEYEASTEEYTHIVHNGNPSKKRLDHVLVSAEFTVRGCEIWNGRSGSLDGLNGNGVYKSDHAPVVAEVVIER